MIRKAITDDYREICRICREDLGYECGDSLVKQRLEKLDSSREAVFVAEGSGRISGFVHVERYDLLYFDSMANILGLAVTKTSRKQGVGRKLMETAECWARDNGIFMMRLNSGAERTQAHSFYRAIGYNEEKQQLRFTKPLDSEI